MNAFFNWLQNLFKSNKLVVEPLPKVNEIRPVLKEGSTGEYVKIAKQRLNAHGFKSLTLTNPRFGSMMKEVVKDFQRMTGLTADGVIGEKTWAKLLVDPAETPVVNDHMKYIEKHKGKKETDKTFSDYLSAFWPKWFGAKTIVGSAFAWCGLMVFYTLNQAGYVNLPEGYITAKKWDGYGQAVEWKTQGIARGAVIRTNSSGDCKSSKGNHVTFANGYCTPQDLTKSGATIGALGGNQNNSVKVSIYKVSNICYVGWPKEKGAVPTVTKSNNCTGSGATDESTR